MNCERLLFFMQCAGRHRGCNSELQGHGPCDLIIMGHTGLVSVVKLEEMSVPSQFIHLINV